MTSGSMDGSTAGLKPLPESGLYVYGADGELGVIMLDRSTDKLPSAPAKLSVQQKSQ